MPCREFDWDDANRDHLWESEHPVDWVEAEEAWCDPDKAPTQAHDGRRFVFNPQAQAYEERIEKRRAVVGSTDAERILTVVFTERNGKVRIITAYPADEDDRRAYFRKKRRR